MNMPGKPVVTPFFHRASNTWSYVVRDPASTAAAIIDAVLDFDAPSGRTSTTMPLFAQREPRFEGDMPFTTTCSGPLAAGTTKPPGHMQNE